MKILRSIPLFLILLIFYNLLELANAGSETGSIVGTVLFSFRMVSDAQVSIDISTLLIVVGLHALYFEILKSLRSSVSTIIHLTLSLIVFIVFLVEFIVVKHAGTPCFLILTFMSLLVVIAGFTVSISSSRRDIMLER
ncbi:MAG: hypothetical protein V2I97_11820 [Desulfococcaceae bacterium]|jgi:hypothetical protein|nr:hypothetical protein [Desulfococcaceae bacterium]